MNSLRCRVSARLLSAAATMTLDGQHMWRASRRTGRLTSGDLQVLAMIDLLSEAAIRLGMMIMPRRLPPG
jgi:hypothetical protein